MPSLIQVNEGKEIKEIDLLELFPASEGFIDQYYGRIRCGKTYGATSDILSDLKKGKIVYCNWKIKWEGYDQRKDPLSVLWHLLTFNNRYHRFGKENLHYIQIDDKFMDVFETLTDCKVYLDEGHVIFDSYQHAKFSMRKRVAILHTGHFDRSIVIISQRPTAVHVSARGNVNRFFKFEKIWSWGFNVFRKTEYQDMVGETVDEEADPISVQLYIGSPRVYNAYDTKYLRGDTPTSQKLIGEVYEANYASQIGYLARIANEAGKKIFATLARLKARKRKDSKNNEEWIKKVNIRKVKGVDNKIHSIKKSTIKESLNSWLGLVRTTTSFAKNDNPKDVPYNSGL